MEKIAVIGSNSFSGSHFIDLLLEKTNYEVIGISRSPEKNSIFLPYKKRESNRFHFFQMDLNKDLDEIIKLFIAENVKKIVNFAAQVEVGPSWDNPEDWFNTNCLSIVNLTNKLRKLPIEKYIHNSTNEIYGSGANFTEDSPYNPSTPYAVSKSAGDMFIQTLIKNFDFPATLVRSTNVYGPGQNIFKIIPRSAIYIKSGRKIQLHGGGEAIKSYIHVRDVCDGILKIMEHGTNGEIYNLSPKSGQVIKDVVKDICDKFDKNFSEATEVVGERLGQDTEYLVDSTKARKELGWSPKIGIDEGLDECIGWVNENWEIIKTIPQEYVHKK